MDSDSEDHSPVRSWARAEKTGVSVREWVIVNNAADSLVDPTLLARRLFNSKLPREEILELAISVYRLAVQYHRSHWIFLFQRDMTTMFTEEECVTFFPNIESGRNIRVPNRRPVEEYNPVPCRDIRQNVPCVRFEEGANSEVPKTVTLHNEPVRPTVQGQDLPVEYPAPVQNKSILKRTAEDHERSRRRSRRHDRESSYDETREYRSRSRTGYRPQRDYQEKRDRRGSERRDDYYHHRESQVYNRDHGRHHRVEQITSQVFYNSNAKPWEDDHRPTLERQRVSSAERRVPRTEVRPERPRSVQPKVIVRLPSEDNTITVSDSFVDRHVQFETPSTSATFNDTGKKSTTNFACSVCPIKGCGLRKPRMKWHVYSHFPKYMRITSEQDERFDVHRRDALYMIARSLLSPRATLRDLVDLVNNRWESTASVIAPEIQRAMQRIYTLIGLPAQRLSIKPVNTPASLIHYRVFGFLFNLLDVTEVGQLNQIQSDQRNEARTSQPEHSNPETQQTRPTITPLYPDFTNQESMEEAMAED